METLEKGLRFTVRQAKKKGDSTGSVVAGHGMGRGQEREEGAPVPHAREDFLVSFEQVEPSASQRQ